LHFIGKLCVTPARYLSNEKKIKVIGRARYLDSIDKADEERQASIDPSAVHRVVYDG